MWKYEIISFPSAKLTILGCHDLTFGFKNDAMWCNICTQLPCGRHSSLYIAIGPAPGMRCFPTIWCTGWANCRSSLAHIVKFMRSVWSVLVHTLFKSLSISFFYSNFINHRFPVGKLSIRTWLPRFYPFFGGFKLALCDTPVAHQIVAGNRISVT